MADPTKQRTVEKITITIEVDKPDPMPMMLCEEVGKGTDGSKDIVVNRNLQGNLLMFYIGTNGYIVQATDIIKGLLAYENGGEVAKEKE